MGLVINKKLGKINLGSLISEIEDQSINKNELYNIKIPVYWGGPVDVNKIFILHSNEYESKSTTKFKDVSAAYDVIGDEKKRSEYDELRRLGPLGAGFNSGSSGFNSGGIPFDISDIFGNFFGNQSNGGGQRGLDIEATLPLSFLDAVNGVTTTLTLGSQRDKGSRSVRVKIPPGVESGQRVRVKGKGQSGPVGPGDLFVIVQVEPHEFFGREGKNLTLVTRVTFPQLVLGSEVKVDPLDGSKVTLRIPPGTPNGRTFRVKGGGVSTSRGLGDLLVTVKVKSQRR